MVNKKYCSEVLATLLFCTCFTVLAAEFHEESKEQRDARMQWWREAKFGMFIHWGLYAIPAGEWKGKIYDGAGEWLMAYADIPVNEYEKLAPQFNPVQFDPAEWVRIAKDAGMKYMVITSKHHDGFSMFDTKQTDYDIVDATPYGKDVLRALSAECRKAGIEFCIYHSILDWHHPSQYVTYGKLWGEGTEHTDAAWNSDPYCYNGIKPPRRAEFLAYLKAQLKELVEQYDPALLWFDGGWPHWWTAEDGQDVMNLLWSLKPVLIINNRAANTREMRQVMGDYLTPEQFIPEKNENKDWESCMTLNDSWGFKRSDHNWKPVIVLLTNLIDIASKGGNFLLNVGPDELGQIPHDSVARLHEIGEWLKVNGEAIYGTRRWTTFREGPTKVEFINSYKGDFKKFKQPDYTPQDILFTTKGSTAEGGTIYAICLAWPVAPVTIKSMAALSESNIESVTMLGATDKQLKWSLTEEGLKITPPATKPCEYAFVFKIVTNNMTSK